VNKDNVFHLGAFFPPSPSYRKPSREELDAFLHELADDGLLDRRTGEDGQTLFRPTKAFFAARSGPRLSEVGCPACGGEHLRCYVCPDCDAVGEDPFCPACDHPISWRGQFYCVNECGLGGDSSTPA
jgi:hypothetical protein